MALACVAEMPLRVREQHLGVIFRMLSSRLGAATEALDEDAIQRLVDLARDGDRLAAQRLYRQHVDRVYRTVRGLLHSDADAEDVTQDAMFTILTSLDRYSRRSGTRFVAWATTVAVNTARRRFRRRRPQATDPAELYEQPDDTIDLDHDLDAAHERAALLDALERLGSAEREIVSLRYGAELNAAEIAKVVGLEPANVRKILERTRARLREQLAAVVGNPGGHR